MIEGLAIYAAGALVVMFIIGLTKDPDDTDYVGSMILSLSWPLATANWAGVLAQIVVAWVKRIRRRKVAK